MATYAGMTDAQVLARARTALKRASELPVGSVQRAIQWAAFDSAMAELDHRAVAFVLARLREGHGDTRTG